MTFVTRNTAPLVLVVSLVAGPAWSRDGVRSPSAGTGGISLLQVSSAAPEGYNPDPDPATVPAPASPALLSSGSGASTNDLVNILLRLLSVLLGRPVTLPTAGAPRPTPTSDAPAAVRPAGNGPAPRLPREVDLARKQGQVTTRDPRFRGWLDEAVHVAKRQWKMPDVTNRHGEKIRQEDFLLAIVWLETRGVHGSEGRVTTSPKGAVGFMQLMPAAARDLGMSSADRNDPRKNLVGGARYLEKCFNDGPRQSPGESGADFLSKIAASYNAGPYLKAFKTKSWQQYVGAGSTEATRYGIGMKMCLGLELSAREKQWYARQAGKPLSWVDQESDRLYAERRGLVGDATQLASAR